MKSSLLSRFNLTEKSLHGAGLLFLVGQSISAALNYAFHLVMGRLLGPADYGILGTLFAIIYVIVYASNTIALTVSKHAAETGDNKERLRRILHDASAIFVPLIAILLVICLAFSQQISNYLHIKISLLYLMLFTSLMIAVFSLLYGLLNGLGYFVWQNATNIFVSLCKFILGAVLVIIGFGVFGSLLGMLLGYVLVIIAMFYYLRGIIFHGNLHGLETAGIMKSSLVIFLTLSLLTVLMSLDQILVKHFFAEFDAGIYAAASILSKTIFFGSSFFVFILFPKVAALQSKPKEQRKLLFVISGYASAMIASILVVLLTFPRLMIQLLYGAAYVSAGSLVVISAISAVFYSFLYLMVHYNLARGDLLQIPVLLAGVFLEVILIYFNHADMFSIVLMVAASNLLMLLSTIAIAFFSRKV